MAATWVDAEAALKMRPCQGIDPSKLKIENQQGNKHSYIYMIFIQNFREKGVTHTYIEQNQNMFCNNGDTSEHVLWATL